VAKISQRDADAAAIAAQLDEAATATPTKGHATPTRKEREAARKRPLVGGNTPEAKKASRAAAQSQRERARIGMLNGEERYLPAKDRGPQKKYVRDYVDARWGLGELVLPLFGVMIITTLILPGSSAIITYAIYGYIILVLIDIFVFTSMLKRKLNDKFGADRVENFRFYAGLRSIYFRRLRTPKTQVKRGEFPK
jgi:hypothetical protein